MAPTNLLLALTLTFRFRVRKISHCRVKDNQLIFSYLRLRSTDQSLVRVVVICQCDHQPCQVGSFETRLVMCSGATGDIYPADRCDAQRKPPDIRTCRVPDHCRTSPSWHASQWGPVSIGIARSFGKRSRLFGMCGKASSVHIRSCKIPNFSHRSRVWSSICDSPPQKKYFLHTFLSLWVTSPIRHRSIFNRYCIVRSKSWCCIWGAVQLAKVSTFRAEKIWIFYQAF